jgi:hypothetical protein
MTDLASAASQLLDREGDDLGAGTGGPQGKSRLKARDPDATRALGE